MELNFKKGKSKFNDPFTSPTKNKNLGFNTENKTNQISLFTLI